MNKHTITHIPRELYDSKWEIDVMEAGVVVSVNDGWLEQHIKWEDISDVDHLASVFGALSVTTFKHLVEALGKIYEAKGAE